VGQIVADRLGQHAVDLHAFAGKFHDALAGELFVLQRAEPGETDRCERTALGLPEGLRFSTSAR
jgi:hypothetical protein